MEGISVLGLNQAINLCRELPRRVREQLRTSLKQGAHGVLETARQQAPRRTGHLAASGRLVVSGEGVSVVFGGSDAPYAGYRMYARAHGHHPDPFLLRAALTAVPVIARRVQTDAEKLLQRVARG